HVYPANRVLPSFPTRRSSDLGNHTHLRHGPRQQVRECSARLERARMLEKLQLENDGPRSETEVRGVDFNDRRAPDVRPNAFVVRSEEHTSELQSRFDLVCRLL